MTNLLPHNRAAADKVVEHFKQHSRAAVIQPTGSGKSWVLAAVAEQYERVLVLAPNLFVLEQAKSACSKEVSTMTYALLSNKEDDEMPRGLDLIVLDEFHRIGAEVWGKSVNRLVAANPGAKILGTTATPVRSLEHRDMADEFFGDNVVSSISLTDAWNEGILRVPHYVIGLISMDSTKEEYEQQIDNSNLCDEDKNDAKSRLARAVLDWQKSNGVPQILAKHIDKEVRRVIVFCQNITRLKDTEASVREWFEQGGHKVAGVYSVYRNTSNCKEKIAEFEKDADGIQILLSVNMLNEGVHINRVDAVLLLRTTASTNIYLQQIGRCFAVGQQHQPVIIDLADNMHNANGYGFIYEAQKSYNEKRKRSAEGCEGDEFFVTDTLQEAREVMESIDRCTSYKTFEERIGDVERFCEEHNRLPGYGKNARQEEKSLNKFMSVHHDNSIIISLRDKYSQIEQETKLRKAENWCKSHNRLPSYVSKFKRCDMTEEQLEEVRLANFLHCHKNEERVKVLREKYENWMTFGFDKKLSILKEYVAEHNRLPVQKRDKFQTGLVSFMQANKDNLQIIAIKSQFPEKEPVKKVTEQNRELFQEFCHKNGRLPLRRIKEESKLAIFYATHPDDPIVIECKRKYSKGGWKNKTEELLKLYEDACRELGHQPLKDSEYRSIVTACCRYLKNDPRYIELRNKYPVKRVLADDIKRGKHQEVRLEELYQFIKTHGCCPRITSFNREERSFARLYRRNKDKIAEKYPDIVCLIS